jgi:carboxymethylenebutenolidase
MNEMVSFTAGDSKVDGYLSRPTDAPKAGVVVLQEWWGLVPHLEDVTRRFAIQGYLALAPDLYHGKSTVEKEEAQHLMDDLDWDLAVMEIKAAIGFLKVEGCAKVGVTGFCMGGALACIAAATADIDAAVAFYGFPPEPNAMAVTCPPTLIFFGENEEIFSVSDAQAWAEQQCAQGDGNTEVVIYPGTGHAFFNDTREDVFHAESAADAWNRTLAHFGQHLA